MVPNTSSSPHATPTIPPPPSFTDVKFTIIGQPQLLKRLATPAPDFRPSPTPSNMELQYPSRGPTPVPPGRPSLLQRLENAAIPTDSSFQDSMFIPQDPADQMTVDQKPVIDGHAPASLPPADSIRDTANAGEDSLRPPIKSSHVAANSDSPASHTVPEANSSKPAVNMTSRDTTVIQHESAVTLASSSSTPSPPRPTTPLPPATDRGNKDSAEVNPTSSQQILQIQYSMALSYESALLAFEKAERNLAQAQETYEATKASLAAVAKAQKHVNAALAPKSWAGPASGSADDDVEGRAMSDRTNDADARARADADCSLVTHSERAMQPEESAALALSAALERRLNRRVSELEREASDATLAWSLESVERVRSGVGTRVPVQRAEDVQGRSAEEDRVIELDSRRRIDHDDSENSSASPVPMQAAVTSSFLDDHSADQGIARGYPEPPRIREHGPSSPSHVERTTTPRLPTSQPITQVSPSYISPTTHSLVRAPSDVVHEEARTGLPAHNPTNQDAGEGRTPTWNASSRTPNPYACDGGETRACNASSQTPNPYACDGGETPAWNASSRTPNPYACDGGETPAWNASSRTPNPYALGGGDTTAWNSSSRMLDQHAADAGRRTPVPYADGWQTQTWDTSSRTPSTHAPRPVHTADVPPSDPTCAAGHTSTGAGLTDVNIASISHERHETGQEEEDEESTVPSTPSEAVVDELLDDDSDDYESAQNTKTVEVGRNGKPGTAVASRLGHDHGGGLAKDKDKDAEDDDDRKAGLEREGALTTSLRDSSRSSVAPEVGGTTAVRDSALSSAPSCTRSSCSPSLPRLVDSDRPSVDSQEATHDRENASDAIRDTAGEPDPRSAGVLINSQGPNREEGKGVVDRSEVAGHGSTEKAVKESRLGTTGTPHAAGKCSRGSLLQRLQLPLEDPARPTATPATAAANSDPLRTPSPVVLGKRRHDDHSATSTNADIPSPKRRVFSAPHKPPPGPPPRSLGPRTPSAPRQMYQDGYTPAPPPLQRSYDRYVPTFGNTQLHGRRSLTPRDRLREHGDGVRLGAHRLLDAPRAWNSYRPGEANSPRDQGVPSRFEEGRDRVQPARDIRGRAGMSLADRLRDP
ncbi:hypothetical protein LshimejAT787_2001190 [Lyophyllum shimeji]|uniref:Uncharacterized protein n=1 Tax=Lyophyllum shimeji TaxID=47721 RepID=A0A9P3Q110_LYOSH|nr:hypothetical protein LshimejAT787_2001190 [Lyophyllum shimeji]